MGAEWDGWSVWDGGADALLTEQLPFPINSGLVTVNGPLVFLPGADPAVRKMSWDHDEYQRNRQRGSDVMNPPLSLGFDCFRLRGQRVMLPNI